MPSTSELLKTELGRAFVEARDKNDKIKMPYKENEIGERVVVAFNPYKQLDKNPYAEIVAKQYQDMIDRTIPKNAILSAQFESWINREKNELLLDKKIAKDNYFKQRTDFDTGEVTQNSRNDIIAMKMDYLNKKLERLEKSFKTFMENNQDQAFANKETLDKWQSYYETKLNEVKERLEKGDFSYYDKKDNVVKAGTREDAEKHSSNLDSIMKAIEEAQKAQSERVSDKAEAPTQDFVGDSKLKSQRNLKNSSKLY